MATANEIIKGAFELIGILAAEEPLEAADSEYGLTLLNDMSRMYLMKDYLVSHTDFILAGPVIFKLQADYQENGAPVTGFTLSEGVSEGCKACLAIRLSERYKKPVSGLVLAQCAAFSNFLKGRAEEYDTETNYLDRTITRVPSQRLYGDAQSRDGFLKAN